MVNNTNSKFIDDDTQMLVHINKYIYENMSNHTNGKCKFKKPNEIPLIHSPEKIKLKEITSWGKNYDALHSSIQVICR